MPTPSQRPPRRPLSAELELERIVSLAEGAELSSLSEDSLIRHHRDKLIKLSPGRYGLRIRDALFLKSAV
jgi:hypothetical protein